MAALIEGFYGALTTSSPETAARLLGQAIWAGWQNCATNEGCQGRGDTLRRWSGRTTVVPDLRWQQKELLVSGTRIVIRGEDTGTLAVRIGGVEVEAGVVDVDRQVAAQRALPIRQAAE